MNWRPMVMTLGLLLLLAAPAAAGDYWGKLFGGKHWLPDCVGGYCCDNYQPKCLPSPPPLACLTCDDYCRKCPPVVRPLNCFTCDDYCPKPFTLYCPPPAHLKFLPVSKAAQQNR